MITIFPKPIRLQTDGRNKKPIPIAELDRNMVAAAERAFEQTLGTFDLPPSVNQVVHIYNTYNLSGTQSEIVEQI